MKHFAWVSLTLVLNACGIGGQWMNGNPSAGKNIKPLLYYWEKDNVSAERKAQDWVECGGRGDGGYTTPNRLPEEKDDFAASRRVFYQIQRCMLQKGYHYTGKCDNEIREATPGCGAPAKTK